MLQLFSGDLQRNIADNSLKRLRNWKGRLLFFSVRVSAISVQKDDLVSQGPCEVIKQEGKKVSVNDYRHEQFLKNVNLSMSILTM